METYRKYDSKIYNAEQSCVFKKTKEQFGGLSNMASGFPLRINGIYILSSEALYQACRFPHLPDVQSKILNQRSPMTAKMVGKPYRDNSRADWDDIKIKVMRWCLKVKLAQNYFVFGKLLESTFDKQIIEDSSKDDFWGAIRDKSDSNILSGINALGRLLMEIRYFYNENRFSYDMFVVEPLDIPNFLLFNKPIQIVDERRNFISFLERTLYLKEIFKTDYTIKQNLINTDTIVSNDKSNKIVAVSAKKPTSEKIINSKITKQSNKVNKTSQTLDKPKKKVARKSNASFLKEQPMLPLK